MSELPPSPADFQSALRRVEQGLSTPEDASIIREYVSEIEEALDYFLAELKKERESSDRFMRALNEALNSGSGAYIP